MAPARLAIAPPPLDGPSAALHDAVHRGSQGGVSRAIRRGADVDSLHPDSGETALMLAGRMGDPRAAELLLKAGADVSANSRENYTALHTSGLGGSAAVVRALIAAGASVHSRTKFGDTPFVSAALRGHRECAELMLAEGADIDAADHNGRTGLMWAATHGRTDMVAALLAAGADHGLHDDKGAQALHNATEHDQLGCMAALLRAGADPSGTRSNGCGSGDTPLHMSVRKKSFNSSRLLLRAGALAHVADDDGFTPLLCAVSFAHTGMVSEILASVRRQDDGGGGGGGGSSLFAGGDAASVPTALATSRRHQQQQRCGEWSPGPLMRRALTAGNHDGWTALHMAAMVYDLGSVNLLLAHGALETEKDRAGNSPFRYPARCVLGDPLPVVVNRAVVVPDPALAKLIVQSLERGPAFRARSWMLPLDAAAAAAAVPVPVRASSSSEKEEEATKPRNATISVRWFRLSDDRRNKMFVRAFRRYANLPFANMTEF